MVERLPRLAFVGISGGEATISPALQPILKAAGRRPVTVNTNAVTLRDDDIVALTTGSVRNVSISLDGFAEIHDVSRNRKGLFDKTVANIRRFNDARRGLGRRRPRLTIKTVLSSSALPRLMEFHHFCQDELEADSLNVSLEKAGGHYQFSLLHCGDADTVWSASASTLAPYADKDGLSRALKDLLALNATARCTSVIYPRMTRPEQVDAFLAADGRGCYRPCALPRAMVVVLPDGEVIPCQSVALGNVRDHDYRVSRVLKQRPYRQACGRIEGFGSHLPPACNLCCFAKVAA